MQLLLKEARGAQSFSREPQRKLFPRAQLVEQWARDLGFGWVNAAFQQPQDNRRIARGIGRVRSPLHAS
jgi:hypothetical protein